VGDEGRQDQGGHLKNALRTPRAVHCLEDKKGDNVERRGTRCSGRRTHQPTKGNEKGHRRRQKETRPSAKGNKKGRNAGEGETRPSGRNNQGYNGKHPREGVPQFAFVLDGVSAFPRSCLPLSSSIVSHLPSCFPVLNGAPAFPRSCLPWSPIAPHSLPLSPLMCAPVLDGVSAFLKS